MVFGLQGVKVILGVKVVACIPGEAPNKDGSLDSSHFLLLGYLSAGVLMGGSFCADMLAPVATTA